MDIYFVKNVINEVNWSKYVIFGENGQNWDILGAKIIYAIDQNFIKVVQKFL